jgi:hypothetical protein
MCFTTLLTKHGPVTRADKMTDEAWNKAVSERRFMTVYHGESDWCTPLVGVVGHHGCCNTICKLAFAKPIPSSVQDIIGMRDNDTAFALCNPQ